LTISGCHVIDNSIDVDSDTGCIASLNHVNKGSAVSRSRVQLIAYGLNNFILTLMQKKIKIKVQFLPDSVPTMANYFKIEKLFYDLCAQ
jgi:hypothetical protein